MRRIWLPLAALLLSAVLSGCSGLSYEDLYRLPQAAEDYYNLQDALEEVLDAGCSYLSPTGGFRREPVQLVDLDGDGAEEALAFFKSPDGTPELYIFSESGGIYTSSAVIEGTGSAVAQVEYTDLSGDGSLELVLAYQVSEAVTEALQIYHYGPDGAVQILSAGCSQYLTADLDGDGQQEVLCLNGGGLESMADAECYAWQDGALQRIGEVLLRLPYDSIRSVQQGNISEDTQAVLLSGVSAEGQLLTDVLTVQGGAFQLLSPDTGILSSYPAYSYYIYPEDADGDGILEIAQARQIPLDGEWVIDWYRLLPDGGTEKRFTTYQNFTENWSLTLPDAWDGQIAVRADEADSGASPTTFLRVLEDGEMQEILTIYTIQGDSRQTYSEEHDLTILLSSGDTLYAVSLAEEDYWEGTETLSQVSERFRCTKAG